MSDYKKSKILLLLFCREDDNLCCNLKSCFPWFTKEKGRRGPNFEGLEHMSSTIIYGSSSYRNRIIFWRKFWPNFEVFSTENADCDRNRLVEISLVEIHIATDQSQFFDKHLWPTDILSQNFLIEFLIGHFLCRNFVLWPNIRSKKFILVAMHAQDLFFTRRSPSS